MTNLSSALHVRQGRLPAQFAPAVNAPPDHETETGFVLADLVAAEGRVAAITPQADGVALTLDAGGCYVLPGFVDLHIHGAAGADVMDADPAALATVARFLSTCGVTSFLATTMTAPHGAILAAVAAVAAYGAEPQEGARLLGVHLEGPYISPLFPGAQPAAAIRPPNLAEFAELAGAGPLRMITLAPEVPGADALIRTARSHGLTVVLGHTDATYEECLAAVELGVSQATHTYNAMSGLHHRRPGALGATLSHDSIYAQLIADNIHVHPAGIKILARCKGSERTVLITDAIRATGMGPGHYDLAGQTVTVAEGACRLADGTLAGSILMMDEALRNFMAATGYSLAEAWPTTSRTPACSIGLGREISSLAPGHCADLVLLDPQLAVVATVVGGRVVYLREPERLRRNKTIVNCER
jgi:N-acetylglucosamine-6-phosphate deacetylase